MIKAGLAGEEKPTLEFNTYVGRPKHVKVMMTTSEKNDDVFAGKDCDKYKGILTLNYPMRHGVVEDWDDMELIWKHIYHELKISPQEHQLLISEAALNPYENRSKIAEIFFENFGVPAIFFETQSVLSLYAQGKITGVVMDVGDGVSQIAPIFEGYAIKNAVQRINLGGRDITENLMTLIR